MFSNLKNKKEICAVGIMTGNSLDAVDTVITSFNGDKIRDLCFLSLPYPEALANKVRLFRQEKILLSELLPDYMQLITETVEKLLSKAESLGIAKSKIDIVGFSGQTVGHCPPSIAGEENAWTSQIGNGQVLANVLGLPVVYDFRSDDIMNGGEGAPLAPLHHLHLAKSMGEDAIFFNAGNTANISVVSKGKVIGFDSSPFNHYPDLLMRKYKNLPCDYNAEMGRLGKISEELLDWFFNFAVANTKGENFFLLSPPKSADPAYYKDLQVPEGVDFYDALRTVEYAAAYMCFFSLGFIPPEMIMPNKILTMGGGWRNPLIFDDFLKLMKGEAFVLPMHKKLFTEIRQRLSDTATFEPLDKYGFSGEYTEARLIADLARCKVMNIPFTLPETTGCKTPTVVGLIAYPNVDGKINLANAFDVSRATKGWWQSNN